MPSCLEWGQETHEECGETADQGYDECSESADQGYDACTESVDQGYNQCSQEADQGHNECCDWWPCSWACDALVWVSNIVCVAWTWVSNVVCVAWTWVSNVVCVAWTWVAHVVCVVWNAVTTFFCVLWDLATTIINAVLVTLESLVGWLLSAVAFLVDMIMMIPYVGAFIRWVINIVTHIVYTIASLVDALLGAIGIRPEKLLRICTIILRRADGTPVATMPDAIALLQLAVDVYRRDANVRVVPLKAFKYSSGFAGGETVDESWIITDDGPADPSALTVPDSSGSAAADFGRTGSQFEQKTSFHCFFGNWRRLVGYGGPVTCFFVQEVSGAALGTALWVTGHAMIEGDVLPPPKSSPRTLGHEVGHTVNLTHTCVDDDNRNLMATQDECSPDSLTLPDRANPRMSSWQAIKVRASKHVTYF